MQPTRTIHGKNPELRSAVDMVGMWSSEHSRHPTSAERQQGQRVS
jgi:hypothetical protein